MKVVEDRNIICWYDPDGYHECSRDEAIAAIKKVAVRKNYVYQDDETALLDFMAVHWAYFKRVREDVSDEE